MWQRLKGKRFDGNQGWEEEIWERWTLQLQKIKRCLIKSKKDVDRANGSKSRTRIKRNTDEWCW